MKTVLLSVALAGFALAGLAAGGKAEAAAAGPIRAKYHCDRGMSLKVVFRGDTAIVTPKGGKPVTLHQGLAADGFLYAKGKYSLRGRGDDATWTAGYNKPLECHARG